MKILGYVTEATHPADKKWKEYFGNHHSHRVRDVYHDRKRISNGERTGHIVYKIANHLAGSEYGSFHNAAKSHEELKTTMNHLRSHSPIPKKDLDRIENHAKLARRHSLSSRAIQNKHPTLDLHPGVGPSRLKTDHHKYGTFSPSKYEWDNPNITDKEKNAHKKVVNHYNSHNKHTDAIKKILGSHIKAHLDRRYPSRKSEKEGRNEDSWF